MAEVVVVVLIIGALTFITVPRLNFGALYRKQSHTVAAKIVTDLRRTRTLAISNAANNGKGYCMQMAGSLSYTGYQIVDANSGATIDTQTIDSHVTCKGDNQFTFGPLGNLLTGSGTSLIVSAPGRTYTITVVSATGVVEYTES